MKPGLMLVVALSLAGCAERPPIAGSPCGCPEDFSCIDGRCAPNDVLGNKPRGQMDAGGPDVSDPICQNVHELPNARLFPLFPQQYINTLGALTGVPKERLRVPIFVAQGNLKFMTSSPSLFVAEREVETFRENAKIAAATLLASHLTPAGCKPEIEETFSACRGFLLSRASAAFRRPLDTAEANDLQTLLELARVRFGMADALTMTMEAVFQSPDFLYRSEIGSGYPSSNGVVTLTPYETASALSYFLTDSPPDALLLAAAEASQLSTGQERAAHARRLVPTAKAHEKLSSFFIQLLGIDSPRQGETPPADFSTTIASMRRETEAFLERHIWAEGADVGTLFSTHETFVDQHLAQHYGVTLPLLPVMGGQWITIPERKGLLAQGSVLVAHPNSPNRLPLHRGIMLLEAFECTGLPAPPINVIARSTTSLRHDSTAREIAEDFFATTSITCSGCHKPVIDLSLSFEEFDEFGRHRKTQFGKAIDAHVSDDALGAFNNGPDYIEALMKTARGQMCLSRHLVTYALGVQDSSDDSDPSCLSDRLARAWSRKRLRLPDLLIEIVSDDSFTKRRFEQ